ncbi:MAG: tetratricopeptide repeat protein [Bryobacteraceae bacterium]
MYCQLYSVVLLIAPLVLPVAAQTNAPATDAREELREFQTQLEELITKTKHARVEQLVAQRVAGGSDAALTYFQAGKSYFDHEFWERSAFFLQKSLELRNTNDGAHRLLGLDWRQLHKPDDAEAELMEAARQLPSNRENCYFAGHQLLLNGKNEAALPYLYKALDSKLWQSQALQAIALAQARLGNYGLAESYYRKAIDSAPAAGDGQFSALVNLGVLLLLGHDTARLEEGLSCARRAAALQPDSPAAHYIAGKALFKLGRLREAAPELARAAKLNPEDSKPHFLLARIYDQLGESGRARDERNAITRIQNRPGHAGMATAEPVPDMPD